MDAVWLVGAAAASAGGAIGGLAKSHAMAQSHRRVRRAFESSMAVACYLQEAALFWQRIDFDLGLS